MSDPRYLIGIDLGTTHSVVAYSRFQPDDTAEPEINLFHIDQVVAPGQIASAELLPSFLLLPGRHDVPEGSLALPWNSDRDFAVGEYARERGAELPARLIASAKSWLSHAGADRTQPILPWESPADARRLSPVDATRIYLEHLRDAWNYRMASEGEPARFEHQDIYLTVPASFDAVARELTVRAAEAAGMHRLTLLEEPQAAFYAWLKSQGDGWRDEIRVGESILVCDIGGGTTDLSLIQVTEEGGSLNLRRVAVGNHILLGGDNMDLTLAYTVRAKLAGKGINLDQWQFRSLWHQCRKAKERLLNDETIEMEPLVVLGRGSSLIGSTIRTELTRQEIESVLVEGFFPYVAAEAFPERKPAVGIREMGLPYESDPAVTRHLAAFLRQHVGSSIEGAEVAFPSAVLFNGGVMKASLLRSRIMDVMNTWLTDIKLRELPAVSMDLAVALGAATYGAVRHGRGIRIRAGIARSYYIGIESAMPSVPGIPAPLKALCVAPFGMEEGTHVALPDKEFGLVVGDRAVFHLLASSTRKTDAAGEIVEDWSGEIGEVVLLEADLPPSDEAQGGAVIPVWIESAITEIGALALWCVARDESKRWKLEFNIREADPK